MNEILQDSSSSDFVVNEGKSADLTVTLFEMDNVTVVDAAAVSTIIFTLFDEDSGAVINDWNGKDVQNANNATISGGLLTIRLLEADNVVVGDVPDGRLERHIARIEFTWNDGEADREGGEDFVFSVRKLPTATP